MKKAGPNENLSGKPKVPSEKHDVLYSKARYVLNQRHIKRPWFNLNPFLEKTDESIDLENFLPAESKYIQPLESLVLRESFHSDHPIDTREMSIDAFFQYLFSDEWGTCCSIRVLEGQLLDQLLLGLYRLENKGVAVRHTTYAFARNHRPRTGCYKVTDSESAGSVEETLLLKFAHFGLLTKEKPNPKTLNTFDNLERETETDETNTKTETISDLPIAREMPGKRQERAMSICLDNSSRQPINPNLPDKKPNWGRHGSLVSKHVHAIGFLKAIQTDDRSPSISIPSSSQQNKRHSFAAPSSQPVSRPKIMTGLPPLSESRRHTTTDQSHLPAYRKQSLAVPLYLADKRQLSFKSVEQHGRENAGQQRSDEGRSLPKARKRFQSRIYFLDFDDDFMSETGEINEENGEELLPEEKDVFFGEELYLSDQKRECTNYLKSAKTILHEKKKELHERRREAKQQKIIQSEKLKESGLPKLPKLNIETLSAHRIHHETINLPDKVPTLEEFVQFLKDDEYYDPRYRNKIRQKSKRIAQRYHAHGSSVFLSLADVPDDIRNVSAYPRSSDKSVPLVSSKKDSADGKSKGHLPRAPTLQESGRRHQNPLRLSEVRQSSSMLQERGQEVLGVTDSEPCKDHYINSMRPEKETRSSSPLFPKISMCEDDTVSSDTDSDDSASWDSLDECFDSKRLNLKYSIERLKKKRRRQAKKRGGFIEVLAKYYNMQNALRVLRKGSAGKESKKTRLRAKHLFKKRQSAKQREEEGPMVIGKLRKFNFLDVKGKKRINIHKVSQGDFSSPNLVLFQEQLNEALDRFVVRREIVVSDITNFYTAATSVTFTKTSCFQHKHRSCKN
ncbi:uncharacterized protein LOC123565035 [Mercenaria mercenaria]|uniref:uncharacterized protein LOC123565035 n=1 Tax=Mercenaria mercenaria TaxID=6596 RepID=UPI00234F057A|nr:uncharacterized protein LOC123565035 [Mercenaria mercenaria]